MPTGYTAGIKEDTTFKEFALQCARGMGALIMMRDDPWDAPIPDEFPPSTYYSEGLAKNEAELIRLKALSPGEIETEMMAELDKLREARARQEEEQATTRRGYERMLAMVREWNPPTPDHVGMKKFMEEQIVQSIDFDCHDADFLHRYYPVTQPPPAEWIAKKIANAERDIRYTQDELAKEVDRQEKRGAWVRALKASL